MRPPWARSITAASQTAPNPITAVIACVIRAIAPLGKLCWVMTGVTSAGMTARTSTIHDRGWRPRAISQPPTPAISITIAWLRTKRQTSAGSTRFPPARWSPKVAHSSSTTAASVKAPRRRHPDVGSKTIAVRIAPSTRRNCAAFRKGMSVAIVPAKLSDCTIAEKSVATPR